jgi:hypothetical protein
MCLLHNNCILTPLLSITLNRRKIVGRLVFPFSHLRNTPDIRSIPYIRRGISYLIWRIIKMRRQREQLRVDIWEFLHLPLWTLQTLFIKLFLNHLFLQSLFQETDILNMVLIELIADTKVRRQRTQAEVGGWEVDRHYQLDWECS